MNKNLRFGNYGHANGVFEISLLRIAISELVISFAIFSQIET